MFGAGKEVSSGVRRQAAAGAPVGGRSVDGGLVVV